MSSNRQSTEQPWLRPPLMAGMVLAITVLVPAVVQAQSAESAFEPEQRSTIDTIPFRAIEEEALANTVIEGGLEAPGGVRCGAGFLARAGHEGSGPHLRAAALPTRRIPPCPRECP